MIYAVIDTNVIVSAHITKNPTAATALVWESVLQGKIIPVFNNEIIEEYLEVLNRKKFNIPESLIDMAIGRILKNGVRGERIMSGEIFPDPQDAVFYEVALSKDDAYLVTGNTKHFPQTPIVVTPTDMVEILRRNQLL